MLTRPSPRVFVLLLAIFQAGMTTVFSEDGVAIPVSVIMLGEGNIVTQVMTEEKHGYSAVQIGYEKVPERKLSKAEIGHLAKSECPPMRHLQEFRVKPEVAAEYQVGQQLQPSDMFEAGAMVDVKGRSVGKGFAGTIKRHGFSRGPMTHGSKNHRIPGSIGMGTDPGRVLPGKPMAGKMGNAMVKERKLEVIKIDEELGCMLVKGSIPGKPGVMCRITPAKIVGSNV